MKNIEIQYHKLRLNILKALQNEYEIDKLKKEIKEFSDNYPETKYPELINNFFNLIINKKNY